MGTNYSHRYVEDIFFDNGAVEDLREISYVEYFRNSERGIDLWLGTSHHVGITNGYSRLEALQTSEL